jgi:SAM-dependent methyltransferase
VAAGLMQTSAFAAVASRPKLQLVLLSSLMLFVELALIRWTGSRVIYLSYFSNFVLLGSFLGIGIGFLRGKARVDLSPYAPLALAVFVGVVILLRIEIDRGGSRAIYFGGFEAHGLPLPLVLPIIFVAVAAVMALVGEAVARTFGRFEPLEAYSLDIGGSLLGIIGFTLLSFANAPPLAWGLVAAVLMVLALPAGRRVVQVAGVLLLVGLLARDSLTQNTSWSPYYRIVVVPLTEPGKYAVSVNGIPHQTISSVAQRRAEEPIYFVPFERLVRTDPGRVLIVGAGTGSDVAVALSLGATSIDAVEIDPRLARIGAERHPDHPYDDPRVRVVIDDGRAFLERSDAQYDLILFALPDSLTLVSGQSSLRLESYLFTREALAQARAHLAPGGVFAMYNYYREAWLIDRLAGTLRDVYGHAPCLDNVGTVGRLAALTVGLEEASVACEVSWSPTTEVMAPATDDYPFLYLQHREVPIFYLVSIGLILVFSAAGVRVAGGPFRSMAPHLDLFWMGAAFLLLETKSVVQFALMFGTTWVVNALVFGGILLSVLAAVTFARRFPLPRPVVLFPLLFVAVAVSWFIQPGALLGLDPAWRFAASIGVYFSPIFLANLVFAQRFAVAEDSTAAFGANLLGAMVGGVVEYAALVTGYQALAVLVAVFYAAAWFTGRRSVAGGEGKLAAAL